MNTSVDIQHIEFVLKFQDSLSEVWDISFLKQRNIIPSHWEMIKPPIRKQDMSLFAFQNGIYLLCRHDLVAFLENLSGKSSEELESPAIMTRTLESFPKISYQGIDMNLEGNTVFSTEEECRTYLLDILLDPTDRHASDQAIVQSIANFVYALDDGFFTLTVRNTKVEFPEGDSAAILSFNGNFHRDVPRVSNEEQRHGLLQIIQNWRNDVESYQEVVDQRFLKRLDLMPVSSVSQ